MKQLLATFSKALLLSIITFSIVSCENSFTSIDQNPKKSTSKNEFYVNKSSTGTDGEIDDDGPD